MVLNDLWPKSRQNKCFLITCQMTWAECRHCILFMHHLLRLVWSIFGFLIVIVAVPTFLLADLICNFHYQTLMIMNRFNYSRGIIESKSEFLSQHISLSSSGLAGKWPGSRAIYLFLLYLCVCHLSLSLSKAWRPVLPYQSATAGGLSVRHYLFLSSHFWSLSMPPTH